MSTTSQTLQRALHYQQAGDRQQADTLFRQVLQDTLAFRNLSSLGKLEREMGFIAASQLGQILSAQGRLEEALTYSQQAVTFNPDDARGYYNLGNLLRELNKWQEAIHCYQRAISLNPTLVEAYNNLGNLLSTQNQITEAVAYFQQALTINPTHAKTYYNLGNALGDLSKFTEALTCYQRALALTSDYAPQIYNSQGSILYQQNKIPEAITAFKQALVLKPTYTAAHSNLLMTLNYSTEYDRATMFIEHKKFEAQHAKPLAVLNPPHRNEPNWQRRLRVGYVSPDFRKHSLAYFIEPVLRNHNHQQFEICCYYNHSHQDQMTHHLRQYVDHWQDCANLTDDALAAKIKADQIDILVDLSGHTAHNRLLVFARKPAPIQVTYLGYVNTTGLTTIDYRLVDHFTDPEGVADSFHSETLLRMPNSYCCYSPVEETPPVNELPALHNRYLTFGAFNNYAKISSETVVLWAQVLQRLPESRLLVKTKSLADATMQRIFEQRLAKYGIGPERLILGYVPSLEATLQTYHQIDLVLDCYPYNGCTTTCQALWMGVPVVTLVGETHAARVGLSFLSSVGLSELVAFSSEEYLNICLTLANNIGYLQRLRASLRDKMQTSPLLDASTFTRQLESIYQAMWSNNLKI